MLPGIQSNHSIRDGNQVLISFEETAAFTYMMTVIGEIFPGKTEKQIEQAKASCLLKLKAPRTREQYVRCLVKELSGN
jgi:hypothetical protein